MYKFSFTLHNVVAAPLLEQWWDFFLLGVIHLVRTHKKGKEGRVKAYAMRTMEEEALVHLSAYAKKTLLSYFVVYCDDFLCCAQKHLL